MKRVKLAMIRTNDEQPCPYGLSINFACKRAGNIVDKMVLIENIKEKNKNSVKCSNNKLLRWSIVDGDEEPARCKYAGKIIDTKFVECNHGDFGAGKGSMDGIVGPPYHEKNHVDHGFNGLYTMPSSSYHDYSPNKNQYYGLYSLHGSKYNVLKIIKRAILALQKKIGQ